MGLLILEKAAEAIAAKIELKKSKRREKVLRWMAIGKEGPLPPPAPGENYNEWLARWHKRAKRQNPVSPRHGDGPKWSACGTCVHRHGYRDVKAFCILSTTNDGFFEVSKKWRGCGRYEPTKAAMASDIPTAVAEGDDDALLICISQ